LEDAYQKADEDSAIEFYTGQAAAALQRRLDKFEKEGLLRDIQSSEMDDEERVKKIRQLVQIGSTEALRGLVGVWIKWVVDNEHPAVVETTADLLLHSHAAVAPLVDQLAKSTPHDDQLRARILQEI
jgi:hypothetical protein